MVKRVTFRWSRLVPDDRLEEAIDDMIYDIRDLTSSEIAHMIQVQDMPDATIDDVEECYLETEGDEMSVLIGENGYEAL